MTSSSKFSVRHWRWFRLLNRARTTLPATVRSICNGSSGTGDQERGRGRPLVVGSPGASPRWGARGSPAGRLRSSRAPVRCGELRPQSHSGPAGSLEGAVSGCSVEQWHRCDYPVRTSHVRETDAALDVHRVLQSKGTEETRVGLNAPNALHDRRTAGDHPVVSSVHFEAEWMALTVHYEVAFESRILVEEGSRGGECRLWVAVGFKNLVQGIADLFLVGFAQGLRAPEPSITCRPLMSTEIDTVMCVTGWSGMLMLPCHLDAWMRRSWPTLAAIPWRKVRSSSEPFCEPIS